MLSQFTKTHLANSGDKLIAKTQIVPIKYYDTIKITICTFTGLQMMIFFNVTYISDFMANLVSQDILYVKRLF